ncbi:MAG: c-type cytochrome, partial [Alphaproteobacteria bacterium]
MRNSHIAVIVSLALYAALPVQAQDAAAGEKLFRKCAACHQVGDGAKNKVGPVLTDVFNRTAGSFDGYKYGKSMLAAGEAGLIWTEENIFNYLFNPKDFLRAYLADPKAKAKMT